MPPVRSSFLFQFVDVALDDSQDNRDLAESSNLLFKDRSDLVGKLKLAEAENPSISDVTLRELCRR